MPKMERIRDNKMKVKVINLRRLLNKVRMNKDIKIILYK